MKKGYKATYNMKCRGLTYEVGKTYTIDNTKICSHGFHYCENMNHVLNYYGYKPEFILLEVEDIGNGIKYGDKTVTNKLKVIRIVPKEEYTFEIPIIKYDSNNNEIHLKDSNGYESWAEYDSNNNRIHFKDSNGYESWAEYDSNNNRIHFKDSYGYEYWKEYDSNNNLIHFKNSHGLEYWKEYDSNNNLIHSKDSKGSEEWREYDSNNNLIHSKNSKGDEWNITID